MALCLGGSLGVGRHDHGYLSLYCYGTFPAILIELLALSCKTCLVSNEQRGLMPTPILFYDVNIS